MDSSILDEGGAKSGALMKGSAIDAMCDDLRTIVEAWHDLTAETRAKLLAIVRKAGA